ncbi:MAG: substrate-binding domain-containing protein [Bryobacterales bacterium]|nr:substrate-binding domain-containing protein [Bryobacterales bacterium]
MIRMPSRRQILLLAPPIAAGCRSRARKLIGVVPKATSHLFFVAVHAGVNQAAAETGVETLWNGPNEETDHGRQIQIVDAMVARHVDALAISATDERALAQPVDRALRTGIPVSIFDSGVNVEGYVTFVATDNLQAGCTAARRLATLIGNHGKIGMVMHKPGGLSTVLREQGFEQTITREFPGVTIAARQFGMSDRAKARAAAENMLTAQPDLAGLFASSEASSFGAIQALTARGLNGKVKLVTFDTSDLHVTSLKNGTVDVMLVQDSFRIGYEAVRSLADRLHGRTPPHRIDLPVRIITRGDLGKPDVEALLSPKVA